MTRGRQTLRRSRHIEAPEAHSSNPSVSASGSYSGQMNKHGGGSSYPHKTAEYVVL